MVSGPHQQGEPHSLDIDSKLNWRKVDWGGGVFLKIVFPVGTVTVSWKEVPVMKVDIGTNCVALNNKLSSR